MTLRLALLATTALLAAPGAASSAAPPAPRFAKQFVAVPAGGRVTVKERGARRATLLRRARAVRFGATVDATKGSVRLVAAAARHGRARWSATASGGAFTASQSSTAAGEVELRLTGGGLGCRPPFGAATAKRSLRVRATGRFATRGCFGRVRPAPRRSSRAGGARAAAAPVDWTLVEYPNGWRVRLVGPLWVEVTDLVTGQVKVLHASGLYSYIYSRRPVLPPTTPVPPASPGTLTDPQGDLLPCGLQTCDDVDLRSASVAVSGGVATFTIETYGAYSAPSSLPVLEIWTTRPTSGQFDYSVDPCNPVAAQCPGFSVARFTSGPPYAQQTGGGALAYSGTSVVRYAVPLSALGGATTFHWVAGSFTCGFTDRIPDAGYAAYPQGGVASARPQAKAAC
ncbi:MAG: hypothetical protein U0T02_09490 [Solirubrobacteraceae bacterium]